MTVDLSGVSPQVAGPYNSGSTAGRSASEVAFKFLTTPLFLPINEGSFRPLKVVLPPGRVVSATKPAPVRTWMTVPMTVAETIFKALGSACPDNVLAGHHADLAAPRTFGLDPKTAGRFISPRLFPAAAGARYMIATGRTRRSASMTAIRTTLRWKQARAKDRFSLPIGSCVRIPAAPENSAADSVWRRRFVCLRPAACNRRWSELCARPGDCTEAKTRSPIASALYGMMDRSSDWPRVKPLATSRSVSKMVFSSRSAAAVASGHPWSAIPNACLRTCAPVTYLWKPRRVIMRSDSSEWRANSSSM